MKIIIDDSSHASQDQQDEFHIRLRQLASGYVILQGLGDDGVWSDFAGLSVVKRININPMECDRLGISY